MVLGHDPSPIIPDWFRNKHLACWPISPFPGNLKHRWGKEGQTDTLPEGGGPPLQVAGFQHMDLDISEEAAMQGCYRSSREK